MSNPELSIEEMWFVFETLMRTAHDKQSEEVDLEAFLEYQDEAAVKSLDYKRWHERAKRAGKAIAEVAMPIFEELKLGAFSKPNDVPTLHFNDTAFELYPLALANPSVFTAYLRGDFQAGAASAEADPSDAIDSAKTEETLAKTAVDDSPEKQGDSYKRLDEAAELNTSDEETYIHQRYQESENYNDAGAEDNVANDPEEDNDADAIFKKIEANQAQRELEYQVTEAKVPQEANEDPNTITYRSRSELAKDIATEEHHADKSFASSSSPKQDESLKLDPSEESSQSSKEPSENRADSPFAPRSRGGRQAFNATPNDETAQTSNNSPNETRAGVSQTASADSLLTPRTSTGSRQPMFNAGPDDAAITNRPSRRIGRVNRDILAAGLANANSDDESESGAEAQTEEAKPEIKPIVNNDGPFTARRPITGTDSTANPPAANTGHVRRIPPQGEGGHKPITTGSSSNAPAASTGRKTFGDTVNKNQNTGSASEATGPRRRITPSAAPKEEKIEPSKSENRPRQSQPTNPIANDGPRRRVSQSTEDLHPAGPRARPKNTEPAKKGIGDDTQLVSLPNGDEVRFSKEVLERLIDEHGSLTNVITWYLEQQSSANEYD